MACFIYKVNSEQMRTLKMRTETAEEEHKLTPRPAIMRGVYCTSGDYHVESGNTKMINHVS